jgi:hypothetical protein
MSQQQACQVCTNALVADQQCTVCLSCKAGPGMGCLMMIKVISARHTPSALVPHL